MKTIFLGLITLIFLVSGVAYAANEYTNSAHGNSTSGVERTDYPTALEPYAQGNCAHCHEQHASIEGTPHTPYDFALFAPANPTSQTTNFCFNCHKGVGSLQSGITNNNYSATFGGATPTFTNIKDAFNPTGTLAGEHDLNDISAEIQTYWPDTFSADSNPCCACHNPHLAKRNKANPGNPAYTAISKPSARDELWGDDADETMKSYAAGAGGAYRAPFYVDANPAVDPTLHEPDGVSRSITTDQVKGSTTPDYDTFCLDCHKYSMAGRLIIYWEGNPNGYGYQIHGKNNGAGSTKGNRLPPYTTDGTSDTAEDTTTNFILSCLDCHEPHGSNTSYASGSAMLRTTVNGKTGIARSTGGLLHSFCSACHTNIHKASDKNCNTTNCHRHGYRF